MKNILYRFSDRLNLFLFVMAIGLILALLFYSQAIVNDLREESRNILEFYARLHSHAAAEGDVKNLNFLFEQIVQRSNFPIINTDKDHNPIYWINISVAPDDRSPAAVEKIKKMVTNMAKEIEPVKIAYWDSTTGTPLLEQYLFYGDSNLITRLIWQPYVEIGIIGIFIAVAFLVFQSIKKSEAQSIWVGLAKETAHQLGTPLSSLMGWLELLKSQPSAEQQEKILQDIATDLSRLNKVAARFSQIGSKPDLKKYSIRPIISNTIRYFQRRLPHMQKKITITEKSDKLPPVYLNADLFEWVLENLIKNSLDAIEKEKGTIEITSGILDEKARTIYIDVKDNGKGISMQHRRLIFRPGFSTKKRGWGLGLNLAKRIIEDYHRGKLIIKETRIGEGTTMRIILNA